MFANKLAMPTRASGTVFNMLIDFIQDGSDNNTLIHIMKDGAAGEIRTLDLPLTKGVLYP